MYDKLIANIIDYAKKLTAERLTGDNNCICLRLDQNSMLITYGNIKFDTLKTTDVTKVVFSEAADENARYADIFKSRPEINCIMHTQPFNASTCANTRVTIPPVLDDMSQIVGANIKTAEDSSAKSIVSALKGRNACLIEGEGMISSGRSLDEAYTACLVLEKAAKTFIEGTALGGCKKLGWLDTKLQRFVYQKKYSKANQSAKMEEVKNGK